MKGINSIINAVGEIINDLMLAEHDDLVAELNKYQSQLDNEEQRLNALSQIKGLCNIKVLCDLNMPTFTGYQWPNKVGELEKKCQRVINRIEKNT